MMKSADYKRGYDAGYKQALLDALAERQNTRTGICRDVTPREWPLPRPIKSLSQGGN